MKKFTIFSLIIILFFALGIYIVPKQIKSQKAKAAAKIKTDNQIFIEKTLGEFEKNKSAKPSEVAKKTIEELNKISKTPYTLEKECTSCNRVEYDDNLDMVILTNLNKKGEMLSRTIIKPPSFITYNKNDN